MSFNESNFLINASLMMEYWYCPRFVYFMECQKISQNEDKRYKVVLGRDVHKKKASSPEYLRKKLDATSQEKEIYLADEELGICGIVDELLKTASEELIIVDYKFAHFKKQFKTQFYQLVFYSLLVQKNYGLPVNRAFIVYTRDKNQMHEFEIKEKDREMVKEDIKQVQAIIDKGWFPGRCSAKSRCTDCTYANVCPQ